MEWTVHQQIAFFLQSICLGLLQGVLFDFFTGLGKHLSHIHRLWIDMAYGPLSALLLFLGGLVIMDGQMHPLLLAGGAFGLLLEHLTIGIYLSRGVAAICRFLRNARCYAGKMFASFSAFVCREASIFRFVAVKVRKKQKK